MTTAVRASRTAIAARAGASARAGVPARAGAPARAPGRDPASRRGHLRVVDPEARRRTRRRRLTVWASVGALVVSVLTVAGFHVQLAAGQLRLERLDAQTQAAQRHYEELRLTVAQQRAPQAIVMRAHALGMVPASDPAVVSAPGVLTGRDLDTGGSGATTSTRAENWEKVKPHLEARP